MSRLRNLSTGKRLSVLGFAEAAAVVLALLSIATLFNEWHRLLELFAHFRAQYLLIAFLLLVLFAAVRRLKMAALMLLVFLLSAVQVLPFYMEREASVDGAVAIKIFHANVKRSNQQPAAFLEQLRTENPDLVVIQEMTPVWLAAMKTLQASYPYSIAKAQQGAFGLGLFSKLPLENAKIVSAPPLDLPEIRAELRVRDRVVGFASAHPMPPMGLAAFEARNQQLSALANDLSAMQPTRILVGDLNITPWSANYQDLERASGMQNARAGFGLAPTFPVFFAPAGIPIDHVLVSDDIGVTDFRVGADTGSDHWPLLVTLQLPH